jgi:hypothetical protein
MSLIHVLVAVMIAFAGFGCRPAAPSSVSPQEVIASRDPPLGPETLSIGDGIQLALGGDETLLRDGALRSPGLPDGLHWMPDLGPRGIPAVRGLTLLILSCRLPLLWHRGHYYRNSHSGHQSLHDRSGNGHTKRTGQGSA